MASDARFGLGGTPVPSGPPPHHARRSVPVTGPPRLTRPDGSVWTPIPMTSLPAAAGAGGTRLSTSFPHSDGSTSVKTTCTTLGDVQSVVASQKNWVRDHCKWDLNKNTLKRYELRWQTTLQREWHPDVGAQLAGTLIFDPKADMGQGPWQRFFN